MSAPRRDDESAEDVVQRATTNLALVIRIAEAEGRGGRHFTRPDLDSEAWYAIEKLLITTRDDVKRLEALINPVARVESGGAR